jgi:hypothetical protein
VRNTKREDLIQFHLSSWGMYIRKELGLSGQNAYLLRDLSPERPIHADDASMILIEAVWEKLRQEYDERLSVNIFRCTGERVPVLVLAQVDRENRLRGGRIRGRRDRASSVGRR